MPSRLDGKKIVVGVTGGIAAYKIPFLIRQLRQEGASVQVVMTESALQFTTALTLSTLSGNDVITGTFPGHDTSNAKSGTWHIDLGLWADAMVIAPATANTMAKLAHGYADNAVTTLALALRCPLIVSPAMDADMWIHETTQANAAKLRELGYFVIPPDSGELASGLTGPGRLPEITVITDAIEKALSHVRLDLEGRTILVTAGPTYEPIDPVRFIGNRSSGKMGYAIARAASFRGANVTLISGPVAMAAPRNVKRIDVERSGEMLDAVLSELVNADALIMSAAVADFAPETPARKKIKKERLAAGGAYTMTLTPTADILQAVSERRDGKVIVGFALETDNGLANAKQKLKKKKLDMIVLNNPLQRGAGFGGDTNIVSIISRTGKVTRLSKMSKFDVAHEILDRLVRLFPR